MCLGHAGILAVEGRFASDDQRNSLRVGGLTRLFGLRELTCIEQGKGKVILYSKFSPLLDSELSVLCDCIFQLCTRSVAEAPVVVFQQNGKIGYRTFVFGIKFLRGAEG